VEKRSIILFLILATVIVIAASAFGGMVLAHARDSNKPQASEFGPGPRTSANGLYVATLQGAKTLEPRTMYTLKVIVSDAATQPISDASIAIGGGMPEHGHGLPTRPRVTKNLGNGWYAISGLRFNMGGWWELKLAITSPAGTDTVTFNLQV